MKLFLLLSLFLCRLLWANSVSIEWEAIEGAANYELEIRSSAKVIQTEKLKAPIHDWKGDLPFGIYQYRVRALNESGAPGEWSDLSPFVVNPEPPELISPTNESVLPSGQPIRLAWGNISGVTKYLVEIENANGKNIVSKTVTTTLTTIGGMRNGDYRWRVTPVLSTNELTVNKSATQSFTIAPIDSSGTALVPPPQSSSKKLHTSISFVGDLLPFRMNTFDAESVHDGKISSVATRIGLGARFAAGAMFADVQFLSTIYRFSSGTEPRAEGAIRVGRFFDLNEDFGLRLSIGPEVREYPGLRLDTSKLPVETVAGKRFGVIGPVLSAEIAYGISQPLWFGFRVTGYYPIAAFAGPGKVSLSKGFTNLEARFEARYRFNRRYALGVGVGIENRALEYQ